MSLSRNVIIGQYVEQNSLIHSLDPRTKIALVFSLMIVLLLANNLVTYSLGTAFMIFSVVVSKVPIRFILRGLKPIILILLITFLYHIWTNKDGQILFSLGPVIVYQEGLMKAVMFTVRILLIVIIASLLTLTTRPMELTNGLNKIFQPLRKIGFPAHEFALMISITLRFIPTLLQETERIMQAQKARGADFTSGNLVKRVYHFFPVVIPLFIVAIQKAEHISLAIESRGYQSGADRTNLHELSFTRIDLYACLITFLFLALLLYGRNG